MTCREFAEFIADYLGAEMAADSRALFGRHLSRCGNCRNYLARYTSTIELGRAAFDDADAPLPSDVPEDLVKAILASRKP